MIDHRVVVQRHGKWWLAMIYCRDGDDYVLAGALSGSLSYVNRIVRRAALLASSYAGGAHARGFWVLDARGPVKLAVRGGSVFPAEPAREDPTSEVRQKVAVRHISGLRDRVRQGGSK